LCVFVHIFSSQLQIVKIIVGDGTIFVCAISFGLIQLLLLRVVLIPFFWFNTTLNTSPLQDLMWRIFLKILLVPHNIVMDLNNVMPPSFKGNAYNQMPFMVAPTIAFHNGGYAHMAT
jgi:hypothetical protein